MYFLICREVKPKMAPRKDNKTSAINEVRNFYTIL